MANTIKQIDKRIQRLQTIMKRLRIEKKLAVVKEQQKKLRGGHNE
jgi:hypothetical protein